MRSLIFAIAILFVPVSVQAQDISVSSSVDNTTIELGSSTQLRIALNGADSVPPIQFPKIDGLDIRYLGPATSVSIINGKMSRSTTLVFRVIPIKTGQFQIPSLTIPIAGGNYSTETIMLTVNESGAVKNQAEPSGPDGEASLQDKVFIVLSVPKTEVYFGEPVPVTIKLFYNLSVKNVQYPSLNQDGFTLEPFSAEPARGQQVIGGISYQFLEFKTFIYPTRSGDLSLGPAKMGANIMIQNNNTRRQVPGDLGAFFDDSIFDEFMGRYEIKTLNLESANIGIKVLPLPEEGKPADFTGGVGKYNFEVGVSPSQVKVGDPLTVRMKINGDGNLKSVELPAFKDSKDLKVYDPKISQESGSKSLEQVVIPTREIDGLPAVSFSYFDPVEKKYFTVTKGPFPLTVTPLAKGEEPKVVGLPASITPARLSQPEEFGQDIHFIKEHLGTVQRRGYALYREVWFVLLGIISFLVWGGLFVNYLVQQRLNTDTRLARRLLAPRQAKNGLALAAGYLAKNDVRNFCDALAKTLQEYFGNKFHVAQNTVTPSLISVHAKNANQQTMSDLRMIFDECELVRFASARIPEDKMKIMLQKAQEMIDYFERSYK